MDKENKNIQSDTENKNSDSKTTRKPINKEFIDIHDTDQIEQENLLAPFTGKFDKIRKFIKQNWFFKITSRLWQMAHYPMKKMNWISFFAVIAIIIGVTAFAINWSASRKRESGVGFEQFSVMSQLEQLKKTHEYYTKVATKEERLMRWVMAFSKWKYQLNGDPKYQQGDCVGAVYYYFQKWGSNFQLENVPWLISRTQNLANRGELKIRKCINDVHSGDIIILIISSENKHVGVVYDTVGPYVLYMDMNVATNMGLTTPITWGNGQIQSICEVSYSLWIGDLMAELNK